MSYGKFRPLKRAKHRKPKPRYVSFRTGEQGWTVHRPEWNPSSRQLKALAILFLVVGGVLGADQVAKVFFPNSPLNPLQNYDPFTLLWNGSTPVAVATTPTFHFFDGPPGVGNGGIICGAGCVGAQTFVDTVTKNDALLVLLDINNTSCIGVTDSQSNTYTQQACLSYGSGNTLQLSTAIASASGSDTVTVANTVQFYDGSLAGYSGVNALTGINAVASTTTSNAGSDSLSPTGTVTGLVFGHFALFRPSSGCNSASCPSPSGTLRARYSQSAGQIGSDDIAPTSDTWSWTGTNCGNAGIPCKLGHVVIDLSSGSGPAACGIAGYNCILSGTDANGNVKLNANSTTAAITLTKAPIDVSTSSAKELFFYETWRNSTNLSVAQPWAWYLTTNSTLPTQKGYFPLNDTNVVLANIVYPNAGDTSKNYYEYMAKTGASQSLLTTSGSGKDPYPSCPQTSTLYICNGAATASGTQFLGISTTLNYTGNAGNVGKNGYSLLCTDSTPTAAPPDPSSTYCTTASQATTLSPCTGSNYCATTTLPFLNMQSGPFYLGFWSSAGQSATILFGTSATGVASARANSVWYWVPNPTVATPSTLDTGGLFGPVIKALLGIGVWIASNIISFIVYLSGVVAPFLAATLSVLVAVLQAELNALGVFFGWGNIGDQFISFASGVVTYFTTGLGDALTWLVRLISRGIDLIKIANFWVGFYLTGVLNVLADALNVISFIVRIGTTITTFLGSSYVLIMVVFFLWYDADMGLAGWHAWFETVKWITFISFDFLERMINFGISSVTWIIGRIPTFDGTTLPELPTIAIGGGPIFPSTDMTSLREGNVFAVFGQMIGVVFLVWFESSGLPGSIGANVPSAPVANVAPFVTMLLIMVAIMGLVFVVSIPSNMVRGTFGLDASLPSNVVGRFKGGIISSGQGVSGRVVKRHPERKFNIVVNRGLGVRGLRPVLRKPKNPISGPSSQGVG